MRKFCVIAIALMLLGIAPLVAANHPTVIAIPRIVPQTGGNNGGALASTVVLAEIDPNFNGFQTGGVPCFNCVPSGLSTTVGLGVPLSWASAGSAMAIELMVDINTFSGTGNFIYSIRKGGNDQNGQVVAHGNVAASVYPANWMAYFPDIVMPPAGRYTINGIFDAGGAVTAVSAPLVTQ